MSTSATSLMIASQRADAGPEAVACLVRHIAEATVDLRQQVRSDHSLCRALFFPASTLIPPFLDMLLIERTWTLGAGMFSGVRDEVLRVVAWRGARLRCRLRQPFPYAGARREARVRQHDQDNLVQSRLGHRTRR